MCLENATLPCALSNDFLSSSHKIVWLCYPRSFDLCFNVVVSFWLLSGVFFVFFLDGNIRERNFILKFKLIYYICLVHMLKCIGLYFYYFYLHVVNHNQAVFNSAWLFCF